MSGIFGKLGGGPDSRSELLRMSSALTHRGPDDRGIHVNDAIALGCTLLRTRGPSESPQPTLSEDGNFLAILDGAIYNGDELRAELERSGRDFRLNSDAELITHLYALDGDDFVKRLRGHFAFAIWDTREKRLVLGRDHLGQKPLFYCETPAGLYFASEMRSLLTVLGSAPQMDFESLDFYLSMRFVPGSGTMLRGIKKVPPAHLMTVSNGSTTFSRFWALSFGKKLLLSHDDYIDGLAEKFQNSVESHMAIERTGAFLSGGLDSSLIVAAAARSTKRPIPTFSIGFAEKEFDEIPYARVISREFGTEQHETLAKPDLIRNLPEIIHGLGEPSDPVAGSFFAASRLAAKHVKIALGGDGGNELFAGCDRYRGVLLANYYSMIPSPLRNAVIAPLLRLMPSSFGYDSLKIKLKWFERIARTDGVGERLAEAVAFFRFNENEKRLLVRDSARKNVSPGSAATAISDRFYESDAEDPIERMQYADYCTRLPEHLLMLVDRMGMANSLEIRSPLVDKELVEFMARLPVNMKVRGQKSRYIWYKLAERQLPLEIAKRKKRGFRFPLANWFATQLNPFLHRVVDESLLAADGIFDQEYMFTVLTEHRQRDHDHSWKIWMLLNLEVWYRLTIADSSLEHTQQWIERLLDAD
ncbi:MAG: asparagine synthase (glutamine-hydrolyzing) [Gammaproteobacteria bacterium]|nr:asparagine synthase (glutamine-hydrolyzing) [Gammaproteobacteria bacterium]NNL51718.1 asparagine synthase (glutamine-hydrolyzing) [Woeseiaceae bacterium]